MNPNHLAEILQLQDVLNARFGLGLEQIKPLSLLQKLTHLDHYSKAIIGEAIEVQEALGPDFYKNWKDREVTITEIQEEVVDVFTFAICMLVMIGLDTPEKIHEAYLNKWNKNVTRQDWTINQIDHHENLESGAV